MPVLLVVITIIMIIFIVLVIVINLRELTATPCKPNYTVPDKHGTKTGSFIDHCPLDRAPYSGSMLVWQSVVHEIAALGAR